jgi:hypothetical protein
LRDGALYITKLPKAERHAPEWQTAAEVLVIIGEGGGDPTMANIAMMKALHRQAKSGIGTAPKAGKGLQDCSAEYPRA